jgi:hypothetical protein
MTRTVTARLTTLCGARQYVCMDGPATPTYDVLIGHDPQRRCEGMEQGQPIFRTFQLVSLMPSDAAVDCEYEEVFDWF